MDINQLIAQVNTENVEKLAEKFMKNERTKTDVNGQTYSTNYLLCNITRYRRAIKNSALPENIEIKLLEIIKGSDSEQDKKDNLFRKNLTTKLLNRIKFNPDKFLEIAIDALDSKYHTYQLAGLIFLTGRRPNELIYNGKFFSGSDDLTKVCSLTKEHLILQGYEVLALNTPSDIQDIMNKYHCQDDIGNGNFLIFGGQSKQHKDSIDNRPQPFPIPCLTQDTKIINAIENVRKKITIPSVPDNNLQTLNDVIHSKFAKSVNSSIKKLYKGLLPDKNLTASELRAFYAITSYDIFQTDLTESDNDITEGLYYSQILGHNEKSLQASFSYANYTINRDI